MPHIPPIYLILFALFTDILGEKQKNTRLLYVVLNLLNAELNPICHLLALLGAHPILHISKIRVKKQHKNYFLVRIRSLSLVHKQYKAIIIIIIWHYSPLWVFTFSAKSLQVLLSLAVSFQFLTFSFFRSSMTSSCHRCLGLPTGLAPIGFQSSSFLVGLAWSILWICSSHLILCALMNLTISAPSIKLSISMLFRILHTLSILLTPCSRVLLEKLTSKLCS